MYPTALDCGIMPQQFWNMSVTEIVDCVDSFRRRQRQQQKQDLSNVHELVAMLSMSFNGGLKPLTELYPELFAEEIQAEQTADVAESRHRWAAAMQQRYKG